MQRRPRSSTRTESSSNSLLVMKPSGAPRVHINRHLFPLYSNPPSHHSFLLLVHSNLRNCQLPRPKERDLKQLSPYKISKMKTETEPCSGRSCGGLEKSLEQAGENQTMRIIIFFTLASKESIGYGDGWSAKKVNPQNPEIWPDFETRPKNPELGVALMRARAGAGIRSIRRTRLPRARARAKRRRFRIRRLF